MQHDSDMLIITDVQDLLWQKQVQWISHHLWTFSSPCQSWSSAANQDGLMSIHGQCLVHSICQAKGFQPAFLGIEQVAGFQLHPQFKFLLNLIRWAGYEMVFERVCDMSDISPVKRHRWPALFVHKDARIRQVSQPWPKAPVAPRDFDALHLHDDSARHAFEPSFQIASKYFSEDFMPKWRNHWTKADIIAFRVPKLDAVLPTFMKQYGNSHNLKESLLRTKGLFGVFLKHDESFLFLHRMRS